MILILSLVLGSYTLFLIAALWAWKRVTKKVLPNEQLKRSITILVPFRNEEQSIHHLIHSFDQLLYPIDRFEVILIDDHSEDNTYNVVKSLIYDKPTFKLLKLNDNAFGKKMAITQGVEVAAGEIVALTDADCIVPKNWLNDINNSFSDDKINLVLGGVRIKGNDTFFSAMQAIEFSSLVGSLAASLELGFFTMGNAANLAFRKAAFQYVKGYEGNFDVPSGDDEYLVNKILDSFPNSVLFIASRAAVVSAKPVTRLKDFIFQRLRWAGKWRYNEWGVAKFIAIYIATVQFALVGAIVLSSMGYFPVWWLISLLIIKALLEGVFLHDVSRFIHSLWSWPAFIAWQLIYPFYVLGIGIMSQVLPYQWKGRRLSSKI